MRNVNLSVLFGTALTALTALTAVACGPTFP